MKEEVWKTTHISSYHEVSNFGRVRTIERTIRKILINQVDILVNLTLMLALLFKLFKLPL